MPAKEMRRQEAVQHAHNADETRDLLLKAQAGDEEARRKLVEDNLRLVASIARRFQPIPAEYDDLFQVGCIGLVKAIDRFDVGYGVRFSTYAVPVIMGEMRQYSRSGQPLRLGRTLHDLARRAVAAGEKLTQDLGRGPTVSEIAAALSVDAEEVAVALEASRPVVSLDEPLEKGKPEGASLMDVLASEPRAPETVDNIDNVVLRQALARLTSWERRLVGLRFFADKPQTEVARLLGVSQAHVSRMEKRILLGFREFFGPP